MGKHYLVLQEIEAGQTEAVSAILAELFSIKAVHAAKLAQQAPVVLLGEISDDEKKRLEAYFSIFKEAPFHFEVVESAPPKMRMTNWAARPALNIPAVAMLTDDEPAPGAQALRITCPCCDNELSLVVEDGRVTEVSGPSVEEEAAGETQTEEELVFPTELEPGLESLDVKADALASVEEEGAGESMEETPPEAVERGASDEFSMSFEEQSSFDAELASEELELDLTEESQPALQFRSEVTEVIVESIQLEGTEAGSTELLEAAEAGELELDLENLPDVEGELNLDLTAQEPSGLSLDGLNDLPALEGSLGDRLPTEGLPEQEGLLGTSEFGLSGGDALSLPLLEDSPLAESRNGGLDLHLGIDLNDGVQDAGVQGGFDLTDSGRETGMEELPGEQEAGVKNDDVNIDLSGEDLPELDPAELELDLDSLPSIGEDAVQNVKMDASLNVASSATSVDLDIDIEGIDLGLAEEPAAKAPPKKSAAAKPAAKSTADDLLDGLNLDDLPTVQDAEAGLLDGLDLDSLPSIEEAPKAKSAPAAKTAPASKVVPKPSQTAKIPAQKNTTAIDTKAKPAAQPSAKKPQTQVVKAPAKEATGEEAEPIWNVFISKVTDEDKRDQATEKLRELTGISAREADELMDKMIIPVAKGVSKPQADFLIEQFKQINILGRVTKQRGH